MARQGQQTLSKDLSFSLKQNFLILDQKFDYIPNKIQLTIKEEILWFYVENKASRLTPRLLLVCIVDHYRSQQKIQVSQNDICQHFKTNIRSLRSSGNFSLRKMGIKPRNQQFPVQRII